MGFALGFTAAALLISAAIPDGLKWTLFPAMVAVCLAVFYGVV
jgi:hypothetical protein